MSSDVGVVQGDTRVAINMTKLKKGRYRHFKGNEYEVIGLARHSETLQEHVVYRALYGDFGLWIRPAEMFLETIIRDGQSFPRFVYVDEETK